MERQLETYQKIERSIIKKFRKQLWTPFIVAVKRYELIQAGDKIAVCISGGKDSMLMAKLLQELQRHSEVPFELVYLVMDPGYNEINRQKIESNAALLHIPITVFETNIFDVANNSDRADRHEHVLRLPAAGHAAETAQHELPGHDADPSDVLHPRG